MPPTYCLLDFVKGYSCFWSLSNAVELSPILSVLRVFYTNISAQICTIPFFESSGLITTGISIRSIYFVGAMLYLCLVPKIQNPKS